MVKENKVVAAKKTTKKKAVKKPSTKWTGAKHQLPKVGDYFKVRWVEGKVLKINNPKDWINEVEIWDGVHYIKNKDLREQLLKSKWFYTKPDTRPKNPVPKWEYQVGTKLTLKQILFCEHYIKNDQIRGNATLCYNEAFSFDLDNKSKERKKDDKWKEIPWTSEYDKAYNLCSAQWSVLSRHLKIQEYNRKLLNELLTDRIVDSQLAKLLFDWKDEVKLWVVKEYNRLNQRVIEKKEVELKVWDYSGKSPEELKKAQEELLK